MKIKGNVALIVLSIIAGLLVILAFAVFIKKDETVTLPITFIEYADFECPACGFYYPMVKKALEKYTSDNIIYEFKHYPLTTIHPYAYNASLASEAAREQNKFDEYSDLLFTKNIAYNNETLTDNTYLSDENLIKYAVELGLDREKFVQDMQSQNIKDRVESDIADGEEFGLTGTPTFIINGRQFRLQNLSNTLTTQEQIETAIIKQFTDYIDSKLALAAKQ